MKRTTYIALAGIVLAMAGLCAAQSEPLGDFARAVRKENKPVATKVFDNDNLPKDSSLSVVGDTSGDGTPAPASGAATAPAAGADAKDTNKPDAAALKTKVEAQKSKIELLSRELDVNQREYRLRAASFYGDAGARLRNAGSWDKEDADYKKKIADQQKGLDDAKKELSDLQEEERKAGVK